MAIHSPNNRVLIYTGGTVTRAVHATGKMPGAIAPVWGAGAQLAAAALNAGTATFAEAAGTDADANADLSVFQGINPATQAAFSPTAMHIGRHDCILQGVQFLTAVNGTVTLKTFGSSSANSKDIIVLTQTNAATTQYFVGQFQAFGPQGIYVPGGFWFTTATAVNSLVIYYELVPAR